ncbi:hypothetical protein ACVIIV_002273 [Bradyrhizobium sp. USDA 4354]
MEEKRAALVGHGGVARDYLKRNKSGQSENCQLPNLPSIEDNGSIALSPQDNREAVAQLVDKSVPGSSARRERGKSAPGT